MKKTYISATLIAAIAAIIFITYYQRVNSSKDGLEESAKTVEGGAVDADSARKVASARVRSTNSSLPHAIDFDDIIRQAEAGDAVAQRLLGERYRVCQPYSMSPVRHKETIAQLAEMRNVSKATVDDIKARLDELCGNFDRGQPIPMNAGTLWLEQSAKSGDLVAKAKLAAMNPTQNTSEEVSDLLMESVMTGNPDALLELAPVLGVTSKDGIDPRYAPFVGNQNDGFAWAVAACRMGADCGPNSHITSEICLASLYCQYGSYDAFVMAELLPPGQIKRVEAILDLLKDRK